MEFIQTLQNFTDAGKNEALFIFLPAGLLALILGIFAFKFSNGGYFLGLGITLCLIAALFLGYGSIYGYTKFQNRYDEIVESYKMNEQKTINEQVSRMKEYEMYTKQNVRIAGIILVIALILIFFIKIKWLSGVGTALIMFSLVTLMVENGFSKAKSERYVETLEKLHNATTTENGNNLVKP